MKDKDNMDNIKLKNDRKALEERIREVKKELRSTWTRPMAGLQTEHLRLKKEATELCILRAWSRGRLHLEGQRELCQQVAERRMSEYQLQAA